MKTKNAPGRPRDRADSQKDTKAADPFRLLEDSEAPAVQAWIREQQIRTREFLDSLPGRHDNVGLDVSYPAMLLSTGARDELVAPVHSFKFAAALQQTPTPVVLLRIQEDAGHAVANSREQTVQLVVDQHVFLWTALGGPADINGDRRRQHQ
jgi:prolyl oligopeptidase PreP (S9A serine peptidase family)